MLARPVRGQGLTGGVALQQYVATIVADLAISIKGQVARLRTGHLDETIEQLKDLLLMPCLDRVTGDQLHLSHTGLPFSSRSASLSCCLSWRSAVENSGGRRARTAAPTAPPTAPSPAATIGGFHWNGVTRSRAAASESAKRS